MKKSLLSWSALFACNLMWALQFTCIKLVQDQIGPFSTVFIPMLLATLFMVPFVYKAVKKNKKRKLGDLKIFLLAGAAGAVSGTSVADHWHATIHRKQWFHHQPYAAGCIGTAGRIVFKRKNEYPAVGKFRHCHYRRGACVLKKILPVPISGPTT
jgi:hypothetical protein